MAGPANPPWETVILPAREATQPMVKKYVGETVERLNWLELAEASQTKSNLLGRNPHSGASNVGLRSSSLDSMEERRAGVVASSEEEEEEEEEHPDSTEDNGVRVVRSKKTLEEDVRIRSEKSLKEVASSTTPPNSEDEYPEFTLSKSTSACVDAGASTGVGTHGGHS